MLHQISKSSFIVAYKLGSQELVFEPRRVDIDAPLQVVFDIGTAGSTAILVQATLPVLLHMQPNLRVSLKGGTHAIYAPVFDYMHEIFLPTASKMGVHAELKLSKRGFFPKGGGEIEIQLRETKPCLKGIVLDEPGRIAKVHAKIICTRGMKKYEEKLEVEFKRQMNVALLSLDQTRASETLMDNVVVEVIDDDNSLSDGCCIFIKAESSSGCLFGATSIGQPRGFKPEVCVQKAVDELMRSLRLPICVDEHLQDQLIILMAFAKSQSRVLCGPVMMHTRTAIHILKQLMPNVSFTIDRVSDGTEIVDMLDDTYFLDEPHVITCSGHQ